MRLAPRRLLPPLLALAIAGPAAAARADDGEGVDAPDGIPAVRLELGLSAARSVMRFLSTAQVAAGACEAAGVECSAPASLTAPAVVGTVGLGLGRLTLEGSVAMPTRDQVQHSTWTGGVRIDTSLDAILSVFFRLAYVQRRGGGVPGKGGRLGLGLQVRPGVSWLVLYGEAALQATSVPPPLRDTGTVLAYTTWLGGGARFAFGP